MRRVREIEPEQDARAAGAVDLAAPQRVPDRVAIAAARVHRDESARVEEARAALDVEQLAEAALGAGGAGCARVRVERLPAPASALQALADPPAAKPRASVMPLRRDLLVAGAGARACGCRSTRRSRSGSARARRRRRARRSSRARAPYCADSCRARRAAAGLKHVARTDRSRATPRARASGQHPLRAACRPRARAGAPRRRAPRTRRRAGRRSARARSRRPPAAGQEVAASARGTRARRCASSRRRRASRYSSQLPWPEKTSSRRSLLRVVLRARELDVEASRPAARGCPRRGRAGSPARRQPHCAQLLEQRARASARSRGSRPAARARRRRRSQSGSVGERRIQPEEIGVGRRGRAAERRLGQRARPTARARAACVSSASAVIGRAGTSSSRVAAQDHVLVAEVRLGRLARSASTPSRRRRRGRGRPGRRRARCTRARSRCSRASARASAPSAWSFSEKKSSRAQWRAKSQASAGGCAPSPPKSGSAVEEGVDRPGGVDVQVAEQDRSAPRRRRVGARRARRAFDRAGAALGRRRDRDRARRAPRRRAARSRWPASRRHVPRPHRTRLLRAAGRPYRAIAGRSAHGEPSASRSGSPTTRPGSARSAASVSGRVTTRPPPVCCAKRRASSAVVGPLERRARSRAAARCGRRRRRRR